MQSTEASYVPIGLALQALCCLSTSATFLRISHETQIPLVFMVLPSILFLLLCYRALCRTDRTNLGMFTGACTGFICGFLSSIINHDNEILPSNLLVSPLQRFFFSLEVLHIPVLIGSLVYMLCLVMERFPIVNSLFLAIATSTCIAMTSTVGTIIYDGEDQERSNLSYLTIFTFSLIESFLLILLPVIRKSQRPWVWVVTSMLPCIFWQGNFFDSLVWDPAAPRFPLPGCLTGLIIVFHIDLVTLRHQQREGDDPMESLLNVFTWHVITFVVQRLSLAVIMLGNSSQTAVESGNDVWLCCLLMIAFLALVAPGNRIHPEKKTIIMLSSLVFYLSISVVSEILTNGYFLDSCFGLACLFTLQYHHCCNRRSILSYNY